MADLLYVQNDAKIIVQSSHPDFETIRNELSLFSTLIERQDPVLVYKMSNTTLWQAAAMGYSTRVILNFLRRNSSHAVPFSVQQFVAKEISKWGALRLTSVSAGTVQLSFSENWHDAIWGIAAVRTCAKQHLDNRIVLSVNSQGTVKQILAQHGLPVLDQTGYEPAPAVDIQLQGKTRLRAYQTEAVNSFFGENINQSGVILLPCGSGKTLVGLAIMSRVGLTTLVVTPSENAAQQWITEALRYTTLRREDISLYRPGHKPSPVTITTYQRIAGRTQTGVHKHLRVLTANPWGLVIYDEVHVLPAPLFRLAAELQSARRLGLTATLVREDNAETDVYSLIGPQCYDADWKQLEFDGYLAPVNCIELSIELPPEEHEKYITSSRRNRHRIAASNSRKVELIGTILRDHAEDSTIIIGHYIGLLKDIARHYELPLITGQTPVKERNRLYHEFRTGHIQCLVLSRVANMAINLPRASVGIQVSGLYASRQEEAQRLGRLLRPKHRQAYFYSLVSSNTVEIETARRRQQFLVEHGYSYETKSIDIERVTES